MFVNDKLGNSLLEILRLENAMGYKKSPDWTL